MSSLIHSFTIEKSIYFSVSQENALKVHVLETMQPKWGFIYSIKLFLTDIRRLFQSIQAPSENNRMEYGNCFEKINFK